MLTRLLLQNVCRIRTSSNITLNKQGKPFPYVLGGLKDHLPSNLQVQFMGKEHSNEFNKTVTSLLHAIERKDRTLLQNLVQPQLLDALLVPEIQVKLTNTETKADLIFTRFELGIGVKFNRDNQQFLSPMQKDQFCVYMPKDPTATMAVIYSGIPILISYHVIFKGGPILCLKNGDKISSVETHSFVLQQQLLKNPQDLMSFSQMGMDPSKMQEFKKHLFSSSNPWKIGNIDHFLKPRLQI